MALLSEQDRHALQTHLASLKHPVTLLLFTQTIGAPESGPLTRQILDEVAGLSDKLSLEEVNFVLERERADQYGVDRIPAIVPLRGGEDTRLRIFGAPAGYEFMSLVEAIRLAGSDDSGLTPASKALIAQYATAPINIQVFVTPT